MFILSKEITESDSKTAGLEVPSDNFGKMLHDICVFSCNIFILEQWNFPKSTKFL